jgi:D-3-phosphoglycerate dehydrogenase / 2-oxoglutarate reductase
MPTPIKRVLRFNTWINPVFDATLGRRSDIELDIRSFSESRALGLESLARANVLHLSPAKDEVPQAWFVTADLLKHAPQLWCVSSGGAGYDTIDVPACTAAGIAVVNQAGGNAESVAEHTLGLLLSVAHRLSESDRALRTSSRHFSREDLMGHEISAKVIGLVGMGHVGTRVAELARAFRMKVLATDPNLSPLEIEKRGATPASLDEILTQSDVVSLHCPRLPSTLKMIARAEFARMKPGAIFISTARGGIHDEQALADALQSGHLAGAGLDVWDVEPTPHDHALLAHPGVVATYHTAGVTHEARRNIAHMSAQQILGLLDGERPPRLLNPEVWETCLARMQHLRRTS